MQGFDGAYLLGSPHVVANGEFVAVGAKEAALLGLLLLEREVLLDRRWLASILWPSSSSRSARHSLSQALYSLRNKVGFDFLQCEGNDLIGLRSLNSDVGRLQDAFGNSEWQLAADCYRGQFLSGVERSAGEELADWIATKRQEFGRIAAEILDNLYVDGDLLPDHPLLGLISPPHIGDLVANRGELDRRYQAFPESDSDSSGSFVGRSEIINDFYKKLQSAALVGFTIHVVHGEAGIGKSSLLERFAKLCVLRGHPVLFATGFAAERNVPFGVVAQWLDLGSSSLDGLEEPWRNILYTAFPGTVRLVDHKETSGHTRATNEYMVLEALCHLVNNLAKDVPLLILVDDVHLADSASISFLHYLGRRFPKSPILFLGCMRISSTEGEDPFGNWPSVTHHLLAGLSDDEIAAFIKKTATDRTPERADIEKLAHRSGRNPLLLTYLLNTTEEHRSDGVPTRIVDFFVPRLEQLDISAQKFLAALGLTRGSVKLAAKVAGLDDDAGRTPSSVRQLVKAGLIVEDSAGRFVPRHGIVVEVALQYLHPADRKILHGRAARALAEEGETPPTILAVQHDIAGHQQAAYSTALQAALASGALYAAREQEFFLKIALSNAPTDDDAAQMRIQLALLYKRIGRAADALSIVEAHLVRNALPASKSVAKAIRLSIQLATISDTRLLKSSQEEIEGLAGTIDPVLLAELYMQLGCAAHDAGQGSMAVEAGRIGLDLVRDMPPSKQSVNVVVRCAFILGLHLDVAEGLSEIAGVRPAIQSDIELVAQANFGEATLLVPAGRVSEAEPLFLDVLRLAEQYSLLGTLFHTRNNLGVCYIELGRFDEAEMELVAATRLGAEFLAPNAGAIARDNLAMLYYESGQCEAALKTARAGLQFGDKSSGRGLYTRYGVIGLAALELGYLAQAYEARREINHLLGRHEYWGADFSYTEMFLARLLAIEGKFGEACQRIRNAIEVYRRRDVLARARLELELARIELKTDPAAAGARASNMLEVLRGSGARPLIERFEEVADSARIRSV